MGAGGLKLFGQCLYGKNTFQKGTSLTKPLLIPFPRPFNISTQSTSTSRNERTNHQEAISRENKQTKAKLLRCHWKILELEGHEDIVTDCDIDEKNRLCVTASRDTTVKVGIIFKRYS